jgi:2,5-diketo-D-gluconate reductase A
MTLAPPIALNNGVSMPQLGFGLYKVALSDSTGLALEALESGYRSLDTAAMYGNEEGVGAAVRLATEGDAGDLQLRREDVFVTTKIWNDSHGHDAALAAFDKSRERLGLDYVDLLLIHWPCPQQDLYVETYRALEQLYHRGLVRAIGVSNFQPEHLKRVLAECEVVPAVNQIELHPWLQQHELRNLHAAHGIATEAWSPLARGALLSDPVLLDLAAGLRRSVAQVALRWQLQLGHIAIPKASSGPRLRENLRLFDFELDDAAMTAIAGLDRGHRSGSHPDRVN